MTQTLDLRQRRMVACALDSGRDALHYGASVEVCKTNDSISILFYLFLVVAPSVSNTKRLAL